MVLGLLIGAAALGGGFVATRNFVRRRLRFVDAVRSPAAPLVAGIAGGLAASVVALPLGALLPWGSGLRRRSGWEWLAESRADGGHPSSRPGLRRPSGPPLVQRLPAGPRRCAAPERRPWRTSCPTPFPLPRGRSTSETPGAPALPSARSRTRPPRRGSSPSAAAAALRCPSPHPRSRSSARTPR